MTEATVTVREVIRLLLEADSYPRIGNEDWPVAARMEAAALEKAATAVASTDDPPEFARWLEGLRNPDLSADERVKNPHVVPITKVTAMHLEIATHAGETMIIGGQSIEVEDTRDKLGFAKPPAPPNIAQLDFIE